MGDFSFRRLGAGHRRLAAVLALIVGLHAIGASMLATRGPLHTHRTGATFVVLDDLRRGAAQTSASERVAARHGHAHGDGAALRHLHAVGDASVSLAAGEAPHGDGGDDGGPGATLAALVALLPAGVSWKAQAPRDVFAAHSGWVPLTHHPAPFERPPRSV